MHRCPACGRRIGRVHQACPAGHTGQAENLASSAHPDRPAPDTPPTLDDYTVIGLLGRGGFGTVWLAEQRDSVMRVAIKVARRDVSHAVARLRSEAEALALVGPPWVPTLHRLDTLDDGTPYLIMELLTAPTLAERLATVSGPMTPADFGFTALAITRVVAAVHARGVVHRDIKPENLFLPALGSASEDIRLALDQPAPGEPMAMLIDFGLARFSAPAREPAFVTQAGAVLGTAEYMAPEQCQSLPYIDARADIYSLGVVLFEMATGRPPFFGPAASVRQDHVHRRPPAPARILPPHLPPLSNPLEQVILRCLAKLPDDRYAHAGDLAAALEHALRSRLLAPPRLVVNKRSTSSTASPRRETRLMPLLLLRSEHPLPALTELLDAHGAMLVESAGDIMMFALTHGDPPVPRAVAAAQAVMAAGMTARVLVDLSELTVRRRSDGRLRILDAALPERAPQAGDPAGVLLTRVAVDAAPQLIADAAGDLWLVRTGSHEQRATMTAPAATRPAQGQPAELDFRPPVGVLGRDDVLAQLMAHARAAMVDTRPGMATVIADAGHGKSALAAELAARLRLAWPPADTAPRVIAWTVRERMGASSSLAELVRALLAVPEHAGRNTVLTAWWSIYDHAETFEQPHSPGEPGLSLQLTTALESALLELVFGWIAPDHPVLRPVASAPGALELAVVRTMGRMLIHCARRQPLLLLCDDIHLAPSELWAVLEYVTRAEAQAPIWLCALARPVLASARPSWGERAAAYLSIELGPLARKDAAALARALLEPAENVSAWAIDVLLDRTQCVPLYLVELVRLLERRGALKPLKRGAARYLAADELARITEIPTARWLAERELGALSPDLARHAQLCALLGFEVQVAEVAGVLAELEQHQEAELLPLDAGASLRVLVAMGLLGPLGLADGARYRFRHALLCEAIAESTPPALRQAIHYAALAYYRRSHGDPARVAHHAAAVGDAHAGALYVELAQSQAARHGYLAAEELYGRALALLPADARALRLCAYRGRGTMRHRQDRHDDAVADFLAGRILAAELGERTNEVELLLDAAMALDWTRDFSGSARLAEEAEMLARGHELPSLVSLRLELARARTVWRRSTEWHRAVLMLDRVVARAEAMGDAAYETLIIALLILIDLLPERGEVERAEAVAARALALTEQRGDILHMGAVLINRRHVWLARGDVPAILADAQRCRELGSELGFPIWVYISVGNQAEFLYQWGRMDQARERLREGLALEHKLFRDGSSRYLALLEARLLVHQGHEEQARAALQALDPEHLSPWGQRLHHLVDVASRDSTEDEWNLVCERCRSDARHYHEIIEATEIRGRWCWRRGRKADAERWLQEALRLTTLAPNIMQERIQQSLDEVSR